MTNSSVYIIQHTNLFDSIAVFTSCLDFKGVRNVSIGKKNRDNPLELWKLRIKTIFLNTSGFQTASISNGISRH
jgi:hypothetical protein